MPVADECDAHASGLIPHAAERVEFEEQRREIGGVEARARAVDLDLGDREVLILLGHLAAHI